MQRGGMYSMSTCIVAFDQLSTSTGTCVCFMAYVNCRPHPRRSVRMGGMQRRDAVCPQRRHGQPERRRSLRCVGTSCGRAGKADTERHNHSGLSSLRDNECIVRRWLGHQHRTDADGDDRRQDHSQRRLSNVEEPASRGLDVQCVVGWPASGPKTGQPTPSVCSWWCERATAAADLAQYLPNSRATQNLRTLLHM